jgi:hypothetical protein
VIYIVIASPSNEQHPSIKSSRKAPYNQITTQSLIHLFQNVVQTGHEEILFWVRYTDNFENKVAEIYRETGVADKTARTQLYKEMLEHPADDTPATLRMQVMDKIKYVTCSATAQMRFQMM